MSHLWITVEKATQRACFTLYWVMLFNITFIMCICSKKWCFFHCLSLAHTRLEMLTSLTDKKTAWAVPKTMCFLWRISAGKQIINRQSCRVMQAAGQDHYNLNNLLQFHSFSCTKYILTFCLRLFLVKKEGCEIYKNTICISILFYIRSHIIHLQSHTTILLLLFLPNKEYTS